MFGSVLVPVPLHPRRRRGRGYNQAERLAGALAARIPGCRVGLLLEKHAETVSQTKLDRAGRRVNVRDAFRLRAGHPVAAETRYVVLDDVLTTGATLHACAGVLRRAGATHVDAAALAHG